MVWDYNLSLPRGDLLIFLTILNYHSWVWDQPILFSAPSTSLDVASF